MSEVALWDKKEIAILKNTDFFAGTREDFMANAGGDPQLCWGQHHDPVPLVTIIITTYKRPQWLKIALESALSQQGFDDYEIVIVDNEGADLSKETNTSLLVKSYKSDKIIYYRHKYSVSFKMDSAVACARTPYICFLHDDDFLSRYHLIIMTNILRSQKDIFYLACPCKEFLSERQDRVLERESRKKLDTNFSLLQFDKRCAGLGICPTWVGALIHREKFIEIGGIGGEISLGTGIGDFIMQFRFIDRYGVAYQYLSMEPLYFYRISAKQTSAGGANVWTNCYMAEYIFYKFCNRKYHRWTQPFWNYLAAINIYCKMNGKILQNLWSQNSSLNIEKMRELCGFPKVKMNSRGFVRRVRLLSIMRVSCQYGFKNTLKMLYRQLVQRKKS